MGQDQSRTSDQNVPSIMLKKGGFQQQGVREDPRYGEFVLYTNGEQQLALITKTCQDHKEYVQYNQKILRAKQLNSIPGMVKLVDFNQHEEKNFCSSFYKLNALYEYKNVVLQDIYGQLNALPCSLELIEGFLAQMINTLKELYEAGFTHGSVIPNFILISNNDGEFIYKLNNTQEMTGFTHYKRVLFDQPVQQWYFAPEQCDNLASRELNPKFDQQKCDVYTLGLCALELGTGLFGLPGLYDYDTVSLNQNVLEGFLEKFHQFQGFLLTHVVRQMLQEQTQHRASFSQLQMVLEQYFQDKELEKKRKEEQQQQSPNPQPLQINNQQSTLKVQYAKKKVKSASKPQSPASIIKTSKTNLTDFGEKTNVHHVGENIIFYDQCYGDKQKGQSHVQGRKTSNGTVQMKGKTKKTPVVRKNQRI